MYSIELGNHDAINFLLKQTGIKLGAYLSMKDLIDLYIEVAIINLIKQILNEFLILLKIRHFQMKHFKLNLLKTK